MIKHKLSPLFGHNWAITLIIHILPLLAIFVVPNGPIVKCISIIFWVYIRQLNENMQDSQVPVEKTVKIEEKLIFTDFGSFSLIFGLFLVPKTAPMTQIVCNCM